MAAEQLFSDDPTQGPHSEEKSSYLVVARRYRPQSFEELVGQEHVGRALANAIQTGRIGHAYLFTGARGVGKTSAARIFAKALNCQAGLSAQPCNRCDICRSIATGEDVDVLEIDGASNRGIDEIRELRQNVRVRPSRSRFKIYIIDEVHMLTREAFNALLKTLEEPPEHVKFIFCTTEAEKIPITILSRCQRFDFAGIQTNTIARRLQQIVEAEQIAVDPAALDLLARRAAGSMRDSQSLLEQLLSFGGDHITLADVHALLGTAADDRIARLVQGIVDRQPATVLHEVDAAVAEGVDLGRLLDQMLGYLRDVLVTAVGAAPDAWLYASPAQADEVAHAAARMGPAGVMAVMQLLDQALSRMRYATYTRTLAELALVRAAVLGDLSEISGVIATLRDSSLPTADPSPPRAALPRSALSAAGNAARQTSPPPAPVRVDSPPAAATPPPTDAQSSSRATPSPVRQTADHLSLTAESAAEVWRRTLEQFTGLQRQQAERALTARSPGSGRLLLVFGQSAQAARAACERPERVARLEQVLGEICGTPVRLEFETVLDDDARPAQAATDAPAADRAAQDRARRRQRDKHPLVQKVTELFQADPEWIEDDRS